MEIFNKNDKLECSLENKRFIFYVASLYQLISDCLRLCEIEDGDKAKDLFSNRFINEFIPSGFINQDKDQRENIFIGEYNTVYLKIINRLFELWTKIEDEGVSDISGSNVIVDNKEMIRILKLQKHNLESLISKL